jgi:hypothetical protein
LRCRCDRRRRGHALGLGPAGRDQRQAAQADARQDGQAARDLREPDLVTERHRARDGAHQRLEVEERPGDLGRHPALTEREQGERGQRPAQRQRGDREHRPAPGRHDGRALGQHRHRQRAQRGAQELHGGHRDRVAAGQQAALGHRDRGRQQQRDQDQAVPGQRGTASAAAHRDQADAAERHHEAEPCHRRRHRPVPHRGDRRDQHRHRPDQQGRVGDAGPRDAGVLHHDRASVPERPGHQHRGRERPLEATAPARHGQQDRGCQPEPGHGEPARRQPGQGHLGQRHGGAPQQPGRGEGCDSVTTVDAHDSMFGGNRTVFAAQHGLRDKISCYGSSA